MKIEDQVCSYSQAVKLQQLGVAQDASAFMFVAEGPLASSIDYAVVYTVGYDWTDYPGFSSYDNQKAAFTSAELGVMLPYFYETRKLKSGNIITKETYPDMYMCQSANEDELEKSGRSMMPTAAIAMADMLIFLLEEGWVSADEVNARLEATK